MATKRRRSYERTARKRLKATYTRVPRMPLCITQSTSTISFKLATHLMPTGTTPTLAQCWQQYRPSISLIPSPQLARYTGAYDLYKINWFRVRFVPRFINFDAGSSLTNPTPQMVGAVDNSNLLSPGGAYDLATMQIFLGRAETTEFKTGNKIVSFTQKYPTSYEADNGEVKRFPWTSVVKTDLQALGIDVFFYYVNFAVGLATSEFDVFYDLNVSWRGKR